MTKKLKGDLLLLLAALIWGLAFVAQRMGMKYIGPFTYNGIRFFIGATALLPLVFYSLKQEKNISCKKAPTQISNKTKLIGAMLAGFVLFIAASFQQVGIVYTTAGKAGFITGLYIVFVPFLCIFLKRRIKWNNWIGVILSVVGLYLISGTTGLRLEYGDLLVFICAVFWSIHIMIISWISPKMNPILLSCIQFYVCALLCLLTGLTTEQTTMQNIVDAGVPILYGGLISISIAYTLQVVAQKNSPPEDASLILSLEALFAAIGGWFILGERLNFAGITGCILMLTGIIVSQINLKKRINQII